MRFQVEVGGKKAKQRVFNLPAVIRQPLLYLRYFGGALAPTIQNRISRKQIGPNYAQMGPFNNSGGMWSGFASRIQGKNAVLSFGKTSLPSDSVRLREIPFKNEERRAEFLQRLKDEGKLKKISNRLKAKSSQGSKNARSRSILEPTKDEVNCFITWIEEHLETQTPNFKAENFELVAVPDRFNQILKRLPNPKNKR